MRVRVTREKEDNHTGGGVEEVGTDARACQIGTAWHSTTRRAGVQTVDILATGVKQQNNGAQWHAVMGGLMNEW
jgi:hypothetical protein